MTKRNETNMKFDNTKLDKSDYNNKIIIIMEICKAPTLRLKTLNKHSIAHMKYIEMEMLSAMKHST